METIYSKEGAKEAKQTSQREDLAPKVEKASPENLKAAALEKGMQKLQSGVKLKELSPNELKELFSVMGNQGALQLLQGDGDVPLASGFSIKEQSGNENPLLENKIQIRWPALTKVPNLLYNFERKPENLPNKLKKSSESSENTFGELENIPEKSENTIGKFENKFEKSEKAVGELENTYENSANTVGELENKSENSANTVGELENIPEKSENTIGELENKSEKSENTVGELENKSEISESIAQNSKNILDKTEESFAEAEKSVENPENLFQMSNIWGFEQSNRHINPLYRSVFPVEQLRQMGQ